MSNSLTKLCTAFTGSRRLLSGPLTDVAIAVARLPETSDTVLVFDHTTGRVIDLDLRGSEAEILERLSHPAKTFAGQYRSDSTPSEEGRDHKGRGRPKLGVVAREVTLLPRHWEWLAAQPGGASSTLRRLVEHARKAVDPHQQERAAQEAAYRFMQAIAGDLPGYEEATRALFAGDRPALQERTSTWPKDIQAFALSLAFGMPDPLASDH